MIGSLFKNICKQLQNSKPVTESLKATKQAEYVSSADK